MPTNINNMDAAQLDRYVIQLCDSIKTAIENKGIVVGSQAVEQYASLIAQITGALQAKTVTPSGTQQVIEPDTNYDGLSKVTVEAVSSDVDENIVPQNIKKNITILGVTGTLEQSSEPVLQTKSVTPSTSSQTITADAGYDGLDQVNVGAVDSSIDSDIQSSNIKSGVTILGVTGSYDGKEPVLEDITITPSTQSQTIYPSQGHDGIYEVEVNAVDNTIDSNIVAGNIKQNVTILGVTGTYEGSGGSISLQDKTVSADTVQTTVQADAGYDGLGTVTINAIEMQTKTVTPDTIGFDVEPDSGYDGLSRVTVEPVDDSIDINIQPENIKSGVYILGVKGTYEGEGGGGGGDPYDYGINTSPTSMYSALSRNNHSDILEANVVDYIDTSNVTTFRECFYQNTEIDYLDISGWVFNNSTSERYMFNGCTNLVEITFADNTPIHDMNGIFSGCGNLVNINGTLNLDTCSNVSSAFANCSSLKTLIISSFEYNSNQTLDLSASAVLDLKTLIDNLPTKTTSRTKTIKVNSAVYTSDLASAASAKGYTLST